MHWKWILQLHCKCIDLYLSISSIIKLMWMCLLVFVCLYLSISSIIKLEGLSYFISGSWISWKGSWKWCVQNASEWCYSISDNHSHWHNVIIDNLVLYMSFCVWCLCYFKLPQAFEIIIISCGFLLMCIQCGQYWCYSTCYGRSNCDFWRSWN